MSGVDITETPGAAERPDHRASSTAASVDLRTGDAADGVGREGRAAGARHRRHRPRPAASSASPTTNYDRFSDSRSPSRTAWCWSPARPARASRPRCTRRSAEISKPEVNIITVEDPVEYRLPGVNQVQVNHKAGLTFAAVLPAILRSDPDVVLIGEIRDRATAQLGGRGRAHRSPGALDAAHQRRAAARSPGSSRWASSRSWSARRSTACWPSGSPAGCATGARRPTRRPRAELDAARWPFEHARRARRSSGGRSAAAPARSTGYRGRLALHEVMPVTEEIERLTVAHASATRSRRSRSPRAWSRCATTVCARPRAGQTTVEEVLRVTV